MELNRDDKAAYMTMGEFKALSEYSTTFPTGTTPGKVWKREMWYNTSRKAGTPSRWWLGQYGEIKGDHIDIHWYEIFITVPDMVTSNDTLSPA